MASDGVYTATPLELVLGTFATSALDISLSANSAGQANTVSRGDHTHKLTAATGDGNGQIKIQGTNINVKGLGSRAYDSTSYLPLTGGTCTGSVAVRNPLIIQIASDPWPYIRFDTIAATTSSYTLISQTTWGQIFYEAPAKRNSDGVYYNSRFFFRVYSHNGAGTRVGYYEDYSLPSCTLNRTSSVGYNILTTKAAVAISQGGTGATSAATALSNLGGLPLSGGTVTGTLTLSKTTDAAGGANNSPALIVGGAATAQHIEIDGNEILSKTNGTTPGTLFLQDASGTVSVAGTGGLTVTAGTASSSTGTGSVRVTGGIGATGNIYGAKVYNSVWNDYAEYRKAEILTPGVCVRDTEDGVMKLTTRRLQTGVKIISDTFGTAMGETEEAKTPIAVAGRVLAYPARARNKYKIGSFVCSAPYGKVDVMSKLEAILFPEAIVGVVSEIPDYEVWKCNSKEEPQEVQVNGRIWIYVR